MVIKNAKAETTKPEEGLSLTWRERSEGAPATQSELAIPHRRRQAIDHSSVGANLASVFRHR